MAATEASSSHVQDTDGHQDNKELEQLKGLVKQFKWETCCFCQTDLYPDSDPWILLCIHSTCYKCLSHYKSLRSLQELDGTNLASSDSSSTVSSSDTNDNKPNCIHCQDIIDVSIHKPNVFLLKYFHEIIRSEASAKVTTDPSSILIQGDCSSCEESSLHLVKYCPDCGGNVCPDCLANHSTLKALRNHKLSDLKVTSDGSSSEDSPLTKYSHCSTHNSLFDRFCIQCDSPVCKSCFLEDSHNGHKWESLEKVTSHLCTYIRTQVSAMEEKMEAVREGIKIGEAKKREIDEKTRSIESTM